MYNGIGLQTVRGTGTSGYVQTNKFNLNRRPAAKLNQSQSDPGKLEGPKQKVANEGILEHNRKREIEKKLLELECDLVDKGFGEEEILERLSAKRKELEAAIIAETDKDRTAETHELAKRKASEMEKMRSAFGLEKEAKEGQAFDRDLQERLKAERIAEKEAKQEAKQKQEKKRKKEAKKAEKAAKKLATKKAKEAEKAAALMEQEAKKQAKEKAKRDAEKARLAAEAKTKRQHDLQKRLGPRSSAAETNKQRNEVLSARDTTSEYAAEDRYVPDPAERYIPREATPLADVQLPGSSPDPVQLPSSRKTIAALPSLSPTPGALRRSGTPSPSPAKVADRKRPPPAREPSPERSGPPLSPPPRKRNRRDSSSLSPAPARLPRSAAPQAPERREEKAELSREDEEQVLGKKQGQSNGERSLNRLDLVPEGRDVDRKGDRDRRHWDRDAGRAEPWGSDRRHERERDLHRRHDAEERGRRYREERDTDRFRREYDRGRRDRPREPERGNGRDRAGREADRVRASRRSPSPLPRDQGALRRSQRSPPRPSSRPDRRTIKRQESQSQSPPRRAIRPKEASASGTSSGTGSDSSSSSSSGGGSSSRSDNSASTASSGSSRSSGSKRS